MNHLPARNNVVEFVPAAVRLMQARADRLARTPIVDVVGAHPQALKDLFKCLLPDGLRFFSEAADRLAEAFPEIEEFTTHHQSQKLFALHVLQKAYAPMETADDGD